MRQPRVRRGIARCPPGSPLRNPGRVPVQRTFRLPLPVLVTHNDSACLLKVRRRGLTAVGLYRAVPGAALVPGGAVPVGFCPGLLAELLGFVPGVFCQIGGFGWVGPPP